MKKTIMLFLTFLFTAANARDNFDLSTLRIGPFHLKMDIVEADKIAGRKIKSSNSNGLEKINYKGETVMLYVYGYTGGNNMEARMIGNITTRSAKFRTRSGMGVGSTRDQLIGVYRNFPSFRVYPEWDDNGKPSKTVSYFVLSDSDAGSTLSFKLVNNITVEVSVYPIEGGC